MNTPACAHLTIDTPLGRMRLSASADALLAATFVDPDDRARPSGSAPASARTILDRAYRQLEAYFTGTRLRFDLPLHADGTAFQRAVWAELIALPYGTTTSYGALARHLGRPKAARAIGAANGKNPLAIIVPCHRVIGSDGSLTGYAGGETRKRWLLDHEARVLFRRARIDARATG